MRETEEGIVEDAVHELASCTDRCDTACLHRYHLFFFGVWYTLAYFSLPVKGMRPAPVEATALDCGCELTYSHHE